MSRVKHIIIIANIIIKRGKCRKSVKTFIDINFMYRENFIQRDVNEFLFLLLRDLPLIRTRLHKSVILWREINWNNAECTLPFSSRPERSEEFVNDRKATRSYLRTHMRSLSAPVNNLYAAVMVCVNTPIYVSTCMCLCVCARAHG